MKKLLVLLSVMSLVLCWLLIRERMARVSLQDEFRMVRLQTQELAEQLATLRKRQPRVGQTPLPSVNAPQESVANATLYGEVAELRARLASLESVATGLSNQLATTKGADIPFVYPDATKRTEYILSGYTTPQSTLQSVLWAITQSDARAFLASLTGSVAETFTKQFQDFPEGIMPGGFRNGSMFRASGFRVLEEVQISADEMKLNVFLEGTRDVIHPVFKRVGGEWKWERNDIGR